MLYPAQKARSQPDRGALSNEAGSTPICETDNHDAGQRGQKAIAARASGDIEGCG